MCNYFGRNTAVSRSSRNGFTVCRVTEAAAVYAQFNSLVAERWPMGQASAAASAAAAAGNSAAASAATAAANAASAAASACGEPRHLFTICKIDLARLFLYLDRAVTWGFPSSAVLPVLSVRARMCLFKWIEANDVSHGYVGQ